MEAAAVNTSQRSQSRVLAVADWSVDARLVTEALRERNTADPAVFALLVPSRLPGLDWVGNPYASRPCAADQLAELERLCRVADLCVDTASVGDPERLSAIKASLQAWPATRIVLFERRRHAFMHPMRLANRLRRSTGLTVETVEVPTSFRVAERNRRESRRARRCAAAEA